MSVLVKAEIQTGLDALTQVVDFPVAPFGYGSDISCDSDLSPDLAEIDGFDTLVLAQAIVRRLDCPRGALPDDPNYGIDIRSYLNRGMTDEEIRAMGGQIRNELVKDDRIDVITVKVTFVPSAKLMTIEILARPFDATLGPFTLTLSATSAVILIEEIRAAA